MPAAAREAHGEGLERRPAPIAAALTRHPPRDFVRLVFIGDISASDDCDPPVCDPAIVGALQSADLVIGNCDSPVVRRAHLPVRSWLGLRRRMHAGTLLGIVSAMGFEPDRLVLSVANDSVLDQSASGFAETLRSLDSLHIGVIGAMERGLIQRIGLGSLTVGLLAFSQWRSGPRQLARGRVMMSEDIPAGEWLAGLSDQPDIWCALPHWGAARAPAPDRQTLLHAADLASRGFGLIAGHHQHCLQPLEHVGPSFVAYGLGAFHAPAATGRLRHRVGAMLVVDVSTMPGERGVIAGYELLPFIRIPERRRQRIVPLDALLPDLRAEAEAVLPSFAPVDGG